MQKLSDALNICLIQIHTLVDNLTKRNFPQSSREISEVRRSRKSFPFVKFRCAESSSQYGEHFLSSSAAAFVIVGDLYFFVLISSRISPECDRIPSSFQLCKQFGLEAERHLLRCLFSSIDFADSHSKNSLQAKLLTSELSSLLNKSTFVSNLCFAVEHPLPKQKVSRHWNS